MSPPRSDELARMALTGLDPIMLARIKVFAEQAIREFDGAPENVPEFQEAQRIMQTMEDQ